MHKWTALGYFYSPDDGVGPITALPEVPEASDTDMDILGGGDDSEEESPEEGITSEDLEEEETDGKKPQKTQVETEESDFDINEPDEEPDEEEGQKEDKKPAKAADEKVPSLRALKETYPDIFKKFPNVRTAIAEHQQFKNVFSNVQDAQEAAEHQQNYLEMSEKVLSGDADYLFEQMKLANPESVGLFAKKFLPALLKNDRNLYLDVTEQPIKQFVKAAFDRAQAEGNANLKNATIHLWKFLTGKLENPNVGEQVDPRDEEFNKRVQNFEAQRYQEALSDASSQANGILSDLVGKEIDPNNALKPITKNALVSAILGDIEKSLSQDDAHMQRMGRLWTAAKRSQYSRGHISRIVSAYLERAKMVLPRLAQKVREEHSISKQKGALPPRPQVQPRPSGGQPGQGRSLRETNPRKIDWQRTSDQDILSGRARLRK